MWATGSDDQIDQHHVDGGAGENGQARAALPRVESEGDAGGDEGSPDAAGVLVGAGEGVDDEHGHHADGHGRTEELDNGAALQQSEETEGEGAEKNRDNADGDEDGGDHTEGDTGGKAHGQRPPSGCGGV